MDKKIITLLLFIILFIPANCIGQSMYFDGVDDSLYRQYDATDDPWWGASITGMTIEFWVKYTSFTSVTYSNPLVQDFAWNSYLLTFSSNTSDNTGVAQLQIYLRDPGTWRILPIYFRKNQWYHISFTFDLGKANFYVDGELKHFFTSSNSYLTIWSGKFQWFYVAFNSGGYGEAQFSELRVWKYARSTLQIQSNYNKIIPTEDGLLLYWRLDDMDAKDYSGYGKSPTSKPGRIIYEDNPPIHK